MRPYLEAAFRHKVLVIIPVALVPLLASLFGLFRAREVESSAVVWVDAPVVAAADDFAPSSSSPNEKLNEREATALRERLGTERLVLSVIDLAGLKDDVQRQVWPRGDEFATQLRDFALTRPLARLFGEPKPQAGTYETAAIAYVQRHISVTASGDHTVVVRYRGNEPAIGAQLVRKTIDAYQVEATAGAEGQSRAVLDALQRQADLRRAALIEVGQQFIAFERANPLPLNGTRPSALAQQEADLQTRYDLALSLYQAAAEQLEQAQSGAASVAGVRAASFRLVDPPGTPSDALNVGLLAELVVIGLIVGAALAAAAIALIVWMDQTVRRADDVVRTLGVPLLASLPRVGRSKRGEAYV